MNKKYFIITIDTEEDNQWDLRANASTENAKYLYKFQDLCNSYSFPPVYLTTYAMAQDSFFVDFANGELRKNTCEIGMHLHAWCSPPDYNLSKKNDNRSYLIEYPLEIMEEKIKRLNALLEDTFQQEIISHRSGRWTVNDDYLNLLAKYGYLCDCSATPGVDWSNSLGCLNVKGSNYSNSLIKPHFLKSGLLEVPVTIRNVHYFYKSSICSLKDFVRECYHLFIGKQSWIRPSNTSLYQMKRLVEIINKEDTDYIMFMIHSSELMPGGSPFYKNEEEIEGLYLVLNELFSFISTNYEGITLKDYYSLHKIK